MKRQNPDTSWESSCQWYDSIVGEQGHHYHQTVILPKSLSLLDLKQGDSLLDLGCGQGVLSRTLPAGIEYQGFDLSPSLIKRARQSSSNPSKIRFDIADITKPLPTQRTFSHAALILVLQNLELFEPLFHNVATHLVAEGSLLIVINHPCFRIPRQSSWGMDPTKKIQYRRIDRYMTHLDIPIQTHPSQGAKSVTTRSFHYPLSHYVQALGRSGWMIQTMEEWISPKQSIGTKAKMENQSRKEFPLFLAMLAKSSKVLTR